MSLVKQLAGQTVVYGIGQILPRIFHFIVFSTYLTYRLGENRIDYAVYLDLYAYTTVLIVLFSYRMDTALFRFGREKSALESTYQTALIPLLFSGPLLVFIGNYFANEIATFLTYPDKGYYVKWFSWIIALDVLILLPMAKLRLQDKARQFVSIKVANVLITIVLVLFFLEILPVYFPEIRDTVFGFAKGDIDFVFLSNLIASASIFAYLAIGFRPKSFNVDWMKWGQMVRYAWPLVIVGIAGAVNQFFGVPLQKFFLGEAYDINKDQAAVYGAVQKIPALLAMFTTAYNYAAEPFFFKNHEHKDARTLYGDIALFFIVVAGVIMLILFLGIDGFSFLIGPEFREGLYLVPILLFAYLFLGIYYNISIWYKLADKTFYGAIIASIGAIITIAGSTLLLPIVGVSASAWIAVVCYMVMVILAYITGQKNYKIHYPLRKMIAQLSFIILITVLGYYFRTDHLFMNLLLGIVLIATYIGVSYKLIYSRLRNYV